MAIFTSTPAAEYQHPPAAEIDPGLFLGDMEHSLDAAFLARHKIRAVVAVMAQPTEAQEMIWSNPTIQRLVPLENRLLVVVPGGSDFGFLQSFPAICDFIEGMRSVRARTRGARRRPNNVLVHGGLRSATNSAVAVVAYLMRKYDEPLPVAFRRVLQRYPVAVPNKSLGNQLAYWGALSFDLWKDVAMTVPKPLSSENRAKFSETSRVRWNTELAVFRTEGIAARGKAARERVARAAAAEKEKWPVIARGEGGGWAAPADELADRLAELYLDRYCV